MSNGSTRPATQSELKALEREVKNMGEAIIEHKMRLENGSKVFQQYDSRIVEVEKKTAPTPLSPIKIIGITLAVFLAAFGALWTLSNMLRDRPTAPEIENSIQKHNTGGHQSMRDNIRAVQTEQAAQRVLIEGVKSEQKDQSKKLDSLLQRVPEKRKRRKR